MTASVADLSLAVATTMPALGPALSPGLAPAAATYRLHSTTVALLNDTQDRLSAAEKTIAAQEKRIRALEALASTDCLTGLMNRRGFEAFFKQERARQRRRGKTRAGCLLLIDLDLFKQINDAHGHDAGDACLQKVADILTHNLRLLDGIARLGGDEFAVLLTDTDMEKAAGRIALLHAALDSVETVHGDVTLRFGASLGAVAVDAQTDYAELYRTADRALYANKQKRRSSRTA